jgi:hypothetical protein
MAVEVESVKLGIVARKRAPAKGSLVVSDTYSMLVMIIDVARAHVVEVIAVTKKRLALISLVALAKSRPTQPAVEHSLVRLAIAARMKAIVTIMCVVMVCNELSILDSVVQSNAKIVSAVRGQQPRPPPPPPQPRWRQVATISNARPISSRSVARMAGAVEFVISGIVVKKRGPAKGSLAVSATCSM